MLYLKNKILNFSLKEIMMREKKRSERFPAEHMIAFSCFQLGEDLPFDHSMGKTVNVGEGGLMIKLYKDLQKGTVLDIEIGIDNEIISAKVEVLNVRKVSPEGEGYFASTRFIDIEDREYKKMIDFYGITVTKRAWDMN